jgi:hypothetical protein
VYLGDPYTATVTAPIASGDTTITLDQTTEFLPSGSVILGANTLTYTSITASQLIGVSGIAAAFSAGTVVRPSKQWITQSQVIVTPAGTDLTSIQVFLQDHSHPGFTFSGIPLILTETSVALNTGTIAIDINVKIAAGDLQEFTNWSLLTCPFYARTIGDNTVPASDEIGTTAVMWGYVVRRDQQLPQRLRVLPLTRSVSADLPGFVLGKYRWRDDTEINAQPILATDWSNIDVNAIGIEKFIAGIGFGTDLEPIDFVQEDDSIYLQVNRGFYFTGPNGYFWPGTPVLEFLSSTQTSLVLSQKPVSLYPVFVGTYALDSQGFYEKNFEYRYQTAAAVAAGTNLPEYYFTLKRATRTITLNKPCAQQTLFIGAISGRSIDVFNMPIYPIDQIVQLYIDQGVGNNPIVASNWTYDRDLGTLVITSPSVSGVSVPGTIAGQPIYAVCTPAVAVLYEAGSSAVRTVDTLDLNPAFSGLSGGYVSLQHRRNEAYSLVLSCDKPLIPIPATFDSIIGLVAYGPVYFNGDYSLLQVTAYSGVPGEVVAGVSLQVIVDPTTFTGTLNGLDPLQETVTVVTGADGIANLVFKPDADYGMYIPLTAASGNLAGLKTTTVSNDTVVLPVPVPISQIWNATDSWMVSIYAVSNTNPYLGMTGADTSRGEVAWATSGTPGTVNYKTNGELDSLQTGSQTPLLPIKALDSAGRNHTDPNFSGDVVSLVYPSSLSTIPVIGAYFVTYLQRSVIQVRTVDSTVESNFILLQMAMPSVIAEEAWLVLNNSTDGILNQYRLGWTTTS